MLIVNVIAYCVLSYPLWLHTPRHKSVYTCQSRGVNRGVRSGSPEKLTDRLDWTLCVKGALGLIHLGEIIHMPKRRATFTCQACIGVPCRPVRQPVEIND